MDNLAQITDALRKHSHGSADSAAYFFKTGPGGYAEHDRFIGVSVPHVRAIAKQCTGVSFAVVKELLDSPFNEERLLALIILAHWYKKGDEQRKEQVYRFYVANSGRVNNWNLVDSSAHLIVGEYLWDKDKQPLLDWAQSPSVWERRIAMVATWAFIRKHDNTWTFTIALALLHDSHDLIHKAVGWMLREAGKKNQHELSVFLQEHAATMPRTCLRYALEKFSPDERKQYLSK